LPGYDFVSDVRSANDGNGIDPNPTDPGDPLTSWHGTHVAGTIGAESNNAVGVAGVSWGATILPVRVLGFGGVGTTFDIFQGVRWAAGLIDAPGRPVAGVPRAQVINLSLGCADCFQSTAQTLFNEVYAAGVVVVAAAGNDGVPVPSYPASYDHVVSVSAVDRFLARAPYSNFGPRVDVAAPGGSSWSEDGILSTSAEDSMEGLQYVYETKQGTSMAAPHVAGVVALMKDVCPTLGPAHVEAFLQLGWMTDDLGVVGRDDRYGWGVIDALASVETAGARCDQPIPGILSVGPGRLDLDPSVVATAVLTASRSGDGDLPPVTFTKSADWLTVTEGEEVDPATKLGTYTVAVDPTADPAVVSTGAYSGSVTFAAGEQQVVTVPVTMRVGGGISADAGHIYFYLYDTESNLLDVRPADPSGGAYRYSFRVSPGSYFVVAGSDSSGDDIPLDPGESCGMYPAVIVANGDRAALDFTVGFDEACAAGPASVSPRWP
jgi:serine protease